MPSIVRLYTSNELSELTIDIHETACDKGWWPYLENPRLARGKGSARMTVFPDGEIEEKIVLIGTELAEAMEEYRQPESDLTEVYYNMPKAGGGTLKIGRGLMDVSDVTGLKPEGYVIEMADAYIRILDLMGAMNAVPEPVACAATDETKVSKHLFKIFSSLFKASVLSQPTPVLSEVLCLIEMACSDVRADLRQAIVLKTAYNKTRPARHGGKKA